APVAPVVQWKALRPSHCPPHPLPFPCHLLPHLQQVFLLLLFLLLSVVRFHRRVLVSMVFPHESSVPFPLRTIRSSHLLNLEKRERVESIRTRRFVLQPLVDVSSVQNRMKFRS